MHLSFHSGYVQTGTLANSEYPDGMQHEKHFIRVSLSVLLAKIKTIFRDRNILKF